MLPESSILTGKWRAKLAYRRIFQAVVQVYPDMETLSHAAAELFVRQADSALKKRGKFSVALSGGQTPRRTYEVLAQPHFQDRVSWPQVHVFWGDERCVPLADPNSNFNLAWQALLKHVPVPEEQIHPLYCMASTKEAAQDYEAQLRLFFSGQKPRFDLCFLGLGVDGHTASLFPGTVATQEQESWTAYVPLPRPQTDRITLTVPLLNQARMVVFLVAGKDKARVLQQVLAGPSDMPPLPAQLIAPWDGELVWLVDEEAAVFNSQISFSLPTV
jgi:6-phosphogluconolactonase